MDAVTMDAVTMMRRCARPVLWYGTMACLGVLLGLLCTAVAQERATSPETVKQLYPKLQAAPFGKGIFTHTRRSARKNETGSSEVEAWAHNPYIAGTQLSYSWAELEPREGDYQWQLIESDMAPWARAGKKCWIEIATANKRDKADAGGRGTPEWVFNKGVPKVKNDNTASYPVFWNQQYIALWGKFVRALAKKFDGDPRLEFVSTGGYANGHEPNLSSSDNDALMPQWHSAGFDGFTPQGTYFTKAIKPILTLFSESFRKTPMAQIIHVKSDFDQTMNAFAAGRKFILLSNGLGTKSANTTGRQAWRERAETLGVKVGYAEWGPSGRETSPEQLQRKKERKRARREGRATEELQAGRDDSTKAKLIDVYRAAIGDDSDPHLAPYSKLSYLPLAPRIPEVETEAEWQAALKWAWEHLKP